MKPYVYNFDNSTFHDLSERIQINLIGDKRNLLLRQKPINYSKKIPQPFKDLKYFQPARHEARLENKNKNTPHKDHPDIQPYANSYYTIKESGFSNVNHKNIFKKY